MYTLAPEEATAVTYPGLIGLGTSVMLMGRLALRLTMLKAAYVWPTLWPLFSDVAFPEKYVTENFQEIFRKISGNFLLNRKNVFIHVSMKTAENTGKLLHSFKS